MKFEVWDKLHTIYLLNDHDIFKILKSKLHENLKIMKNSIDISCQKYQTVETVLAKNIKYTWDIYQFR